MSQPDVEHREHVLTALQELRDDTWNCRCPPADPAWMDWLIDAWTRLAPGELEYCPADFVARNTDTCYYVDIAFEQRHPGRSLEPRLQRTRIELAVNTKDRIGQLIIILPTKLRHRGVFWLGNDNAFKEFLESVTQLLEMDPADLSRLHGTAEHLPENENIPTDNSPGAE